MDKKRTATAFRLPKETVAKLDWLKSRYHFSTRTDALILAISNETFRLTELEKARLEDKEKP